MICIENGTIRYFVKQEDNSFKEVVDIEEYNKLQEPLRKKWNEDATNSSDRSN